VNSKLDHPNRADTRRLRDLEAHNAELQEKLTRRQTRLRDAVVSRDATIYPTDQIRTVRMRALTISISMTVSTTMAMIVAASEYWNARMFS
jgi:hypothetical protein